MRGLLGHSLSICGWPDWAQGVCSSLWCGDKGGFVSMVLRGG